MIELLTGLAIFLITQLSKKLKMPTTYVLVGLVLVASFGYTALQYNDPALLEKLTMFMTTAFATSQAMRLILNKLDKELGLLKKLGLQS